MTLIIPSGADLERDFRVESVPGEQKYQVNGFAANQILAVLRPEAVELNF
jgi:hypothetical protein